MALEWPHYDGRVHDEGTERVPDNTQQMAGVSSLYLIALMHHEPRAYNAERFLFQALHQPAFLLRI